MTRSRTTKSAGFAASEEAPVKEALEEQTQEDPSAETVFESTKTEKAGKDPKAPVNIELSVSEELQEPAEAAPPEKIQTSVRERLSKKTPGDNPFVPSNPAALEKAAEQVAQEQGFTLNRGTSIGARLIARAQGRG